MLDIGLVLAAGFCQLVLAVIGFPVSTRPPETRIGRLQSAFILAGLIGCAAIVWSGIRSASLQAAIEEGIDKLPGSNEQSSDNLSNSQLELREQTFANELRVFAAEVGDEIRKIENRFP